MYCTINESAYWYEISGQGDKVMLLHGFTGSSATWSKLVSLLEHNYQVITIDLPGHGKTKVDQPKSMDDCCSDIKTLLQVLAINMVHMLGYSMGGRTALSFAIAYPDMVQSLVLESASAGLESKKERTERKRNDLTLAQKIMVEGIESFVNNWENIPLFDSQKQLPEAVRKSIREERLSQHKEGLAMSLAHMGNGVQPSYWQCLSTLQIPVLLIAGEWDLKFIKLNKAMRDLFPEGNLIIVEKAGHAIHMEQSDFFGKIVSEFFRQNATMYTE
ncbi:2-succinyl-6-hydroxy-2,4-cyclohexadiene-1-carboxylate synthase [Virgibacillus phasianinus]|uniref:Putative 2-succinyl-6-hydroxy-2,4-cyclohexadiene-1-carboxylate synthase n=1 Tax=Virgibacillus phasianinus TaxID=2017483 RepID=A0A220U4H4_9BACI|nr:2-succinyl-6-hydroxy-2,4-cyclohexadiene-1-carboxylate synthase [Virgibacillus phasianinus]ASK62892.1 2-succinyl-6-hydroxy-2,4-cyclohexadiene-1-carboxylate synthase [Virgibacillus phasianinus]